MAQLKFGSAGATAREIDLSGPVKVQPVGVPAGVIGTANQGPAFVPVTVGTDTDFYAKFGQTDGKKFGPLAVVEWLRNASAVTYLRVLGVGDGKKRLETGNTAGTVFDAGFVVGEQQPSKTADGTLSSNPYANAGGEEGRLYFLGAFMSESAGSDVFSSANLQGQGSVTPGVETSVPIVRGVVMAASGVILRLSSSFSGASNVAPASDMVATNTIASGGLLGSVVLMDGTVAKEQFVMMLNGHKGTDSLYPNVITASFNMTSPNYFANTLNTDPEKLQQAGYYLYSHWDIHPSTAVVTGSGLVLAASGAGSVSNEIGGTEPAAFLTTGALGRNVGDSYTPNYENWNDRFSYAKSSWITSQKFGGVRSNLFKVHALDAGSGNSEAWKISIENIAPSTDSTDKYGSFDLVIRNWNDRDSDQLPLEQWRGLNLDPSSDRYIAKVIGDANVYYDFDRNETAQKIVVDGQYPLNSNLIRIEMAPSVDEGTLDPTALPIGVRGISHLMTSGSRPLTSADGTQLTDSDYLKRSITPPVPMRKNITKGTGQTQQVNSLLYWGVQFEHVTSLTLPNASTLKNKSLKSFAKYYPGMMTNVQKMIVGDNNGVPDTDENGIIDADRFNLNAFSLDNIRVVTASNGLANSQEWDQAVYVRDGNIVANATNKTRAVTTSDFNQANRSFLKYSFFIQGGFDGVNLFDSDEAALNANAVTEDMNATNRNRNEGPNVRAYSKALDIMKNLTNVDLQLLAIPGIRHPIVTNDAVDAVEERFDALYLMDIEQYDNDSFLVTSSLQQPNVTNTATQFANRALDTSFAAAYFPDVLLTDPNTLTNLVVPPSTVVLGALALNDAVGHPWFAPAGYARGALPSVLEAQVKLSKQNMDELYDVDINPLVAFPGSAQTGTNPTGGVVVWGQKTLQQAATALDRVNVRRLLIEIRRQVRLIANTILFEPNREATLQKFSTAIEPKLQRIQALSGLERFKIIIDSSTTTQQDVLNNTIRGNIYVQPTKSVEFVSLDFEVTNNIASI